MIYHVNHSTINVSAFSETEEMKRVLENSALIRQKALDACFKIPSYKHKSLYWKNKYYDLFRNRFIKEIGGL